MIKLTDKESYYIRMAILSRASSRTIRRMELEFISTLMGLITRVSGPKTSHMALGENIGKMAHPTKESMSTA